MSTRNVDTLERCDVWDPSCRLKPAEQRGQYVPEYPVYIALASPSSNSRGWFWLYTCTHCGGERIMSNVYVHVDGCTCAVRSLSIPPKSSTGKPPKKFTKYNPFVDTTVGRFDRSKICMRATQNGFKFCDNFKVCQDYRRDGSLGPLYSKDKKCYVCTYKENNLR